jgi:DNA-3-methyladenine glycosylase
MNHRLDKEFFDADTVDVARNLIGKALIKVLPDGNTISAIIAETEAYLPDDPASHSYPGLTKRNAPMFEDPGTIYVYRSFGIHLCMNIVTLPKGTGSAVLIRAGIPLEGIGVMRRLRGVTDERMLLRGPGNFAKGFGINLDDNYISLIGNENFYLIDTEMENLHISSGRRIGISKAIDKPWRFFISRSEFVSRKNTI